MQPNNTIAAAFIALFSSFQFLAAQVCFTSNPVFTYSLGSHHADIHTADIDADGDLDLIATNREANTVQIMKRDGTGGNGEPLFSPTVGSVPVGTEPLKLFIGDFDHDNDQDIAVTNKGSNNISILRNDGNGGMTVTTYNVGTTPIGITGGHFNNDTHVDLAVANFDGNSISILFGDGAGGFTVSPDLISLCSLSVCNLPIAILARDFDGDGKDDLAVTLSASNGDGLYQFMKGDGVGGFIPQAAYSAGLTMQGTLIPSDLDTGDFNNDGLPDLAITYYSIARRIVIVTGQSNSFPSGSPSYHQLNTGSFNYDVSCADYNGDGNDDIAVVFPSGGSTADSIKILLGRGDATFPAEKSIVGFGSSACAITHADLNGDGKPDLVTGNNSLPNGSTRFDVYVLLNKTPYFNVDGDTSYCSPQAVTLTADNPALVYSWTAGGATASGDTFSFNAASPNNYFSVSGNDGLGCINTSFGLVKVTTVNTNVNVTGGVLTAYATNAAYQWLGCALPTDTIISGATLQSYTPTISGSYAVQITVDGCVDTSGCFAVSLTTGIEGEGQTVFRIYPNPNNGQFYVDAGEDAGIENIVVTDMTGRTVKELRVKEKKASVILDQPAGIYFVSWQTGGGWHSQKIIIQ